MKRIRESYFRQRPFLGTIMATLQRAGWIAALVILAALPSHAYSWYSGVSVGSDGTIYGWGVTDITSYVMVHQAYVATKLTSPKGRQASLSEGNAPNYYREDVQLSLTQPTWERTRKPVPIKVGASRACAGL